MMGIIAKIKYIYYHKMEHLDHLKEYFMHEIELQHKEKIELDDNNKKRNYFMYFFVLLFIILFICKLIEII